MGSPKHYHAGPPGPTHTRPLESPHMALPGHPHAGPLPHYAPMQHPGVTCNGCNGPVAGTRFKCTVCPKYDLCSTCRGRGLHNEHALLPISHPMTNWFEWFPRGKLWHKMRHCMWANVQAQAQPGPSGAQEKQDTSQNIGENGETLPPYLNENISYRPL